MKMKHVLPMMVFATRLLILWLLLILPANAGFYTGARLIEGFRLHERYEKGENIPNKDLLRAMRVNGYILGIHDVLEGLETICTAYVTAGTISAIVMKY